MRQTSLYPGEDGYWVVECPSLPGCISQGRTRVEAIENIQEAIALYVEALGVTGGQSGEQFTEAKRRLDTGTTTP